MSLLQEMHRENCAMLATMPTTERKPEDFYAATGLDLSDCLYREENAEQLEKYLKTGEIPADPRGFDYTDLIEKGCFLYNSRQWLKAHYNGNKPILEVELMGYVSYCNGLKAKINDFSNFKHFANNIKQGEKAIMENSNNNEKNESKNYYFEVSFDSDITCETPFEFDGIEEAEKKFDQMVKDLETYSESDIKKYVAANGRITLTKFNSDNIDDYEVLERYLISNKTTKLPQSVFNRRCEEVFESDEACSYYSIEVENDEVKIRMSRINEDGRRAYFNYIPDMSERPQALAYLLGDRDDFND